MELPGSSYLYALATVSITFVGFSALLLIFRQAMGSTMTRYESYFMLSFMQVGFIVTIGSLSPPALALYGWSPTTVWRLSSTIMAIPVMNAIGTPIGPGVAPYAAAMLLCTSGIAYLLALAVALREPAKQSP
jgi:archaellum biogenesis protein FlaJ (TadC family)